MQPQAPHPQFTGRATTAQTEGSGAQMTPWTLNMSVCQCSGLVSRQKKIACYNVPAYSADARGISAPEGGCTVTSAKHVFPHLALSTRNFSTRDCGLLSGKMLRWRTVTSMSVQIWVHYDQGAMYLTLNMQDMTLAYLVVSVVACTFATCYLLWNVSYSVFSRSASSHVSCRPSALE